jgi:hydrogenase large subunit
MYGRACLRDEQAPTPYEIEKDGRLQRTANRERALEKLAENDRLWNFNLDPLTRTESSLSLLTAIDFDQRRILDARVEETRPATGIEITLKGRQPSDSVPIVSRTRGLSSGAHAIAAAIAVEMASGSMPPPLAILARNIGSCCEVITQNIQHLFLLAGPDYSEAAVSRTSLALWGKAQKTRAPNVDHHGLETIADLMRGMNLLTGYLYLEALQMGRLSREVCSIIFGKYPHPTTIVPGGIGIEISRELFNHVLGRVNTILDYAKKVTAIWDDLVNFFYDSDSRYRRVGELPGNLFCAGVWDDYEKYDATYMNSNDWGEGRMAVPGIVINNELRTRRLTDINIGIEEFVDHSYLEAPALDGAPAVPADPLSEPISPHHPWNRETKPRPAARNWKERYSWSPAPRWDREPVETGPIAMLSISALAENRNCEFINPVRRRELEIDLPKGQYPAVRLRWRMPERPNTLERNRARAYSIAYAGMVAFANILQVFDCIRRGELGVSARFRSPERKLGIGFWECGSGAVTHFLNIRNYEIHSYQIISPTEWMGSPRDAIGIPGIYEAALMNTPLLEQCARAEDFTGIDILRTIRSFDP